MSFDLSDTLVVAISATALFDLAEADAFYRAQLAANPAGAVIAYRDYMRQRENDALADGTGMPLVRALLSLNRNQPAGAAPLVEVVVMSRNTAETGVQVFNNIRRLGLPVQRHAFTGGASVVPYLHAFDVDLFLTTHVEDAQRVIDANICAVAIVKKPPGEAQSPADESGVRIAFDGDAVLFSDESEIVYKSQGLPAFQANENAKRDVPMNEGPYASFLRKLARVQERLAVVAPGDDGIPPPTVRIAIVTARSAPAEMRVINTLRHWGVTVDEVFFLGGLVKTNVLRAFRPHIFFDDQDVHLEKASGSVPSGKVPYRSDSPLQKR